MAARYIDAEIAALLRERKPLPADYRRRFNFREKRGHRETELEIAGQEGSTFRLIGRQSTFNVLDFSIILAVSPPGSSQLFRLRRYNGKHGEHTNLIERNTFYDFHIHTATERYQELGMREDSYAEPTDRFGTFDTALRCLFEDCGFDVPPDPQRGLFEQEGL
jgi:hypothetical protein